MSARQARRDVLAECIRRIDVERGAAGMLNRVFGFKLVKLLKECLPDIGNGHLTSNFNFHGNSLNYQLRYGAYTFSIQSKVQ
jgi:hypothetical protein